MRFLVDENLSFLVVDRLLERGHFAEKVDHIGLAGMRDDLIWKHAFDHDEVVITCNAGDFLTLAAGSELHAGLIIVRRGDLLREEQWTLLEPVIVKLESLQDQEMVNRYIEIFEMDDFTWPARSLPE